MPNVFVQFDGQTLTNPGAYYQDNVSAYAQTAPALVPPLVLIGNCYGMAPLTPQTFYTQADAMAAVKGGPVSAFIPFIFNPSSQLNGASAVTIINVAPNTQSTYIVQSAAAQTVMTLTSAAYGPPANQLQISIANGTIGGKNVTLLDGYSGASVSAQNLGLPFQVAYTNSTAPATGITIAVTAAAGAATGVVITSSNAGESVTIPLGGNGYTTVGQVVDYLNGLPTFTAVLVSNGNLPATALDTMAATTMPAPTGSTYSYLNIYSKVNDFAYWVNNVAGLATAVTAAATGIANIPFTNFSGATGVAPTLSNYAGGFNLALNVPGFVVFADTNLTGVPELGAQHAVTASTPLYGRARRFISGSSAGDSVATTLGIAESMNAYEATYCYPGVYANSPVTGVNQLFPGLYVAAMVAGMISGNPVATPLTNKSIFGTGVELISGLPLTTSQLAQLQSTGVLTLTKPDATGVPTILSDVTTWQEDSNPENVFNQQVGCRQYLSYVMLQTASPFIGTVASPFGKSRQKAAFTRALNQQIYNQSGAGVLSSWTPTSLTLTYTGAQQLMSVTVSVVFVNQIRFELITTFVQPQNF